ncbi:MAG: glycine cleavage system aminomethyltransferase GcvT [Candidatus Latescibacteria bacterium]|nr:glycine cleavage system aminomethyltransferase GcvT [Candidatus Latescibacterota bacterium]
MSPELKHTPLRAAHLQSGARLVEFGGWEMPVQYRGIGEEHQAVRHRVGIFDVSHMGQVAVKGPGSQDFLQYLLPRDLAGLGLGHLCYSVMCDDRGKAVDDLLVYRPAPLEYLLVVNASRQETDLQWLRQHASSFTGVEIEDRSPATGMLALQGPQAEQVVIGLGGTQVPTLEYLQCRTSILAGEEVLISRSGYTGEDGFEILCSQDRLTRIWDACLDKGALPCGLGARDVLRTEMGYCLYGHELSEERTPLEAGLAWTLSLGKPGDFVGKQALLEQQLRGGYQRLVGLKLIEQGIPRPEFTVLDYSGKAVGKVSSGTYSPVLQRGIALAFVAPHYRNPGAQLQLDLRGKARRATVVRLPFVPSRIKGKGKP